MTPRIRVAGTHFERGRQYGAQARAQVHLSVQAYQRVFAHYAGWDWPAVRRAAAGFEAPIAAFGPAYLDEMRGIADGAGLDLADVLAINVRTEVMYAAKARQAPLACPALPIPRPIPRLLPGPIPGPVSGRCPLSAAPSRSFRPPDRPGPRRSSARTGTGCSTRPGRWSSWRSGRTTARTSSPWWKRACWPRPA